MASGRLPNMEEFYRVASCSLVIAELNDELQSWERTHNNVRPRQSLSYLSPREFLAQSLSRSLELLVLACIKEAIQCLTPKLA